MSEASPLWRASSFWPLDHRDFDCGNRIADGVGVVRISAGIEDNTVTFQPCGMKNVDQLALVVGLRKGKRDAHRFRRGGQVRADIVKRYRAVNAGLSFSEQIQIRSVQNKYSHGIPFFSI